MKYFKTNQFLITLLFILLYSDYVSSHPIVLNLPKSEYKADSKNWDVCLDNKGYTYFANDKGLLEFDGARWKLYQLPNKTVLRSVATNSSNIIYTGSFEEFGRWDRTISGDLKYTSLSDSIGNKKLLENDDIWRIFITDQYVYFQSFSSIFVYDYKTVSRLPSEYGFLFLSEVRGKLIVQSMNGALYNLQGLKLTKIEGSEIFIGTDVRIILPYQDKGLLLGTASKGFYVYDEGSFRSWDGKQNKLLTDKNPNTGILTQRGTYYIGTLMDGLYELDTDGEVLSHSHVKNVLQSNTVLSLCENDIGNVWVGLDGGISYVKEMDGIKYYADYFENIGSVYDAVVWNDYFLLATNQCIFYMSIKDINKSDVVPEVKVLNNTSGQNWGFNIIDDKLYCSHNNGLKIIGKNLNVSDIPNARMGNYKAIGANVNNKELIVMASYLCLRVLNSKTGEVAEIDKPHEPIYNIEIDHLENIWLEHPQRGVYRCRFNDDYTKFDTCVYFGGNSGDGLPYRLKLFKIGGRVELYGDKKFYTYNSTKDEIVANEKLNECFTVDDEVVKVVQIKGSDFWALGKNSLTRFYYDGYSAKEGITIELGADFSLVNNYENLVILNDSINLVCLDNGFIAYNNKQLIDKKERGKYLIQPFLQSVKTIKKEKEVEYLDIASVGEIQNEFNSLTFTFTAKYKFDLNLSFEYRLKSVNNEWTKTSENNTAEYDRLPAGRYQFEVRTIDNFGNKSGITAYEFEILLPWYLTTWAILAYVVLFVLLLYIVWIFVLRRYRNIHLHKIRQREVIRLRNLAENLKEEVESKDAELFTLTSFIVKKNELIIALKDLVIDFYNKNNIKSLLLLIQQVKALLNKSMDTENDWKMFLIKFEEKHSTFFKSLKDEYPELTNNDLRLCACLKLNMDTKEIASLMNLSIRSVENNRYRLRKKIGLSPSQNLNDFLIQF